METIILSKAMTPGELRHNDQLTSASVRKEQTTVVPATAGHRWFRGKVALRGRWPLVTGNGHICAIMSNQTHTSDSIYFTAHAQHYKAQRPIAMMYTVKD